VNALALSAIRTVVPIIVGGLVSWLITVGVELDAEAQAGFIVFLTGLLQAVYYLVVRVVEQRWPEVGVLLGAAKTPDTYSKGDDAPTVTADAVATADTSTWVELPPLDEPGPDHRA